MGDVSSGRPPTALVPARHLNPASSPGNGGGLPTPPANGGDRG
ncbi:Uncharacterised protein [Amycolatopsis camponoti]|uniref:Uncharacterized protein n=1 Tax=Amycolatopsis camponoti TaxID=2606593 RepID=A0A6I8LJY2_9PSEU|nr:Uncharacterised protein [Amycolatopsis camponoti]